LLAVVSLLLSYHGLVLGLASLLDLLHGCGLLEGQFRLQLADELLVGRVGVIEHPDCLALLLELPQVDRVLLHHGVQLLPERSGLLALHIRDYSQVWCQTTGLRVLN
jgi:hypothetical protein